MFKRFNPVVMAIFVLIALNCAPAFADDMPYMIDWQEIKAMSAEERTAHIAEKRKAYQALPDAEKEHMMQRRHDWWRALSDEEKAEIKEDKRAFFDSLAPEEKAKWQKQRQSHKQEMRKKWQHMSEE